MKTLAEKLFEFENLDMELFDKVNEILGCDPTQCLRPGFTWGTMDITYDEYDCSIEVFRPAGAEPMSEQQANLILDLGFNGVYENFEDKAYSWCRKGRSSACARTITEETHRLRNRISALSNRVRNLENLAHTLHDVVVNAVAPQVAENAVHMYDELFS